MSDNLNENLYKRFGLQLDRNTVESGFRKHISNLMWDAFYPLHNPSFYKEEFHQPLQEAREIILRTCSKELFLDYSDYTASYGIEHFIRDVFDDDCVFEEFLIRIQVILNVFWDNKTVHEELETLSDEIEKYLNDFPILGVTIKSYKTKAPQILPATSKRLDKEIIDTLGVLDTKQFKSVLDDFEAGLKLFAKAKTDSQFKDIVEDMHASCDEVVKIVLNDKNKSFKHATDKNDHKKLGLNGHQKEIFKNLKNWMDGIKHGSKKNIDRAEVEMIISMTASFIRFVAVKGQIKN
ncbi:MAG: hypothetical protein ABIJ91_05420 [Candidatus Kuenenbacteria bacterium]